MDKSKLLFNHEYEEFYNMVEKNDIFSKYCEEVFGIDFSQDGFSDIHQVKDLIKIADIKPKNKVLDIGCGNGKMAEYIADQTGATVYGFDYSENAIMNAKIRTKKKSKLVFEEGIIGEKEYAPELFDVILSVDTMYFALNMEAFVKQLYGWLKPDGIFIAYYEEGHLQGINEDVSETVLAQAFKENNIRYETVDYTKKHYELMKHKRKVIEDMKALFLDHDMEFYYNCAVDTSIDINMLYDDYKKNYNRYMYIARKNPINKADKE